MVSHLQQSLDAQSDDGAALEVGKVANVLQNEEARAVVVTIAKVGADQAALEHAGLSVRESVTKKNEQLIRISEKVSYGSALRDLRQL